MQNSSDIVTILGYVLFAFSEIVPLLPIPANGILHSLSIGIRNSFTKPKQDVDLELAHTLVDNRPQIANIVSMLEGNFRLTDTVKILNTKPQLIQYVKKLSIDKNLQFINSILTTNPDIVNDIKNLLVNKITQSGTQSGTPIFNGIDGSGEMNENDGLEESYPEIVNQFQSGSKWVPIRGNRRAK